MDGTALEINFDSIAGPSYNYEALAPGNLASVANLGKASNPQSVALEGLDKIALLLDIGIPQALLPPLARPNLDALFRIGLLKDPALLTASDTRSLAAHLSKAAHKAPHLLAACFSGSSFWTNNSATVSPSADADDNKVHLTPANMISSFHRSLEANEITSVFRQIFANEDHFVIHEPLPYCDAFGDEGAANHLRFGLTHGNKGLNVFVYGRDGFDDIESWSRYRPRQTRAAGEAIARLHCLDLGPDRTLFFKQNQEAIQAGIFHNDVISVNNLDLFLFHEQTFDDTPRAISEIGGAFKRLTNNNLKLIEVKTAEISLREAAASYLFNSQLVRNQNGEAVLLSPQEGQRIPSVAHFLEQLNKKDEGRYINHLQYVNVTGSMRAGGGPACLRLRIVLDKKEREATKASVFLDKRKLTTIREFILKNYLKEVRNTMFAEEDFLRKCFSITRELYLLLELQPYYFDYSNGRGTPRRRSTSA